MNFINRVRNKLLQKGYDKAVVTDMMAGRGPAGPFIVAGKTAHQIIGEVEVVRATPCGDETLFTKMIDYNDLLVNGSVYMSEKINNFRSSFAPTPLDVDLGVHALTDIVRDNSTIKDEIVCGLVIGIDGCTNTYNTVKPVQRHHKCVPGIVPFRTVPTANDLQNSDQAKYFLRTSRVLSGTEYSLYYGKAFEKTGEIKVMFEDGTDVPTNADILIDPKFIKTYTEYKCMLDQRDVREYFKITTGSTRTSRVNSVGLVTGYPIQTFAANGALDQYGNKLQDLYEYGNVRCITTLNMENQELKDSSSTITFIYRLIIL